MFYQKHAFAKSLSIKYTVSIVQFTTATAPLDVINTKAFTKIGGLLVLPLLQIHNYI